MATMRILHAIAGHLPVKGGPNSRADTSGSARAVTDVTATSGRGVRLPHTILLHNDSATLTQCPVRHKLSADEAPCPRPNTMAEEALACVTMLLTFGAALLLPYSILLTLFLAIVYRNCAAAMYLTVIMAACFIPPGQSWPAFRHWGLFDTWRRRFRTRIITPPHPSMDSSKHYLCAQFPHACFPMACVLNPALIGLPGTGMPGGEAGMQGVVASILLQLPFFRHLFAWIGGHPADSATLRGLLQHSSVGMQPEGIAGIFSGAGPGREAVFLARRKGFVRVAIQAGVDILPVYHLGNSQMFSFWGPVSLSRRLRMSVGFFWGAYCLPLPRKHDLVSLAGYPIKVRQNPNPTQREVDEVHAQFIKELRRMFDHHKHLVGWEHKQLEIR